MQALNQMMQIRCEPCEAPPTAICGIIFAQMEYMSKVYIRTTFLQCVLSPLCAAGLLPSAVPGGSKRPSRQHVEVILSAPNLVKVYWWLLNV